MKIHTTVAAEAQRKTPPADSELGFGCFFTDHMFLCDYSPMQRWHDARIVPHQALELDPACMVLHYSQQVFEGIKAFRGVDGSIRLFRHQKHLERMQRSAERLCMCEIDLGAMDRAIKELVLLDQQWIPRTEGCALYIRPTMIAMDPHLGVRPSQNYLFYVILSPVGAYYPQGFDVIDIMVQDDYVRAFAGGVGDAKTGGNYAASLRAQVEAKAQGFTQVLWLDGKEHKYVEEVGTMNMFFVIDDEVVTSPLSGTIIAGVTRDSVLQLLRHWGEYRVSERPIAMDELVAAAETGRLKEAFGTGTAAVISPVGGLSYRGQTYKVQDGQIGPLSRRLHDHIFAVQYGHQHDEFGWVERIGS